MSGQPAVTKRMGRELYFPTPVYFTDLAGATALNQKLLELIRAWREQDPAGTMRSNVAQTGAWHSPTDMHLRAEYDDLTLELFEFVDGVFNHLGYSRDYEPVCDSMWANVNPPQAFNRQHTHPQSLWSGVYYVQAPDNCGLLWFTDPRAQAMVLAPYYDPQRRRSDTWHEVYYQPVPGRLILFPAWLPHAVQPNLTQATGPAADRISVSFNFRQCRRGATGSDGNERSVVRDDVTARAKE